MNEVTCPQCGRPLNGARNTCPHCEPDPVSIFAKPEATTPEVKPGLLTRIKQMSLAGKIAGLGAVIFIPSFLFSLGSTPLIWSAVLMGIGFFMFLIKVGTK